jgi:homocysteine S-methyltransferase
MPFQNDPIASFLASYPNRPIIIDGALATELETKGHDLNHPLWSAKALQEDPDDIFLIHLGYYRAGADVAITASYQASTAGLQKNLGITQEEAKGLIVRSVALARRAKSVAPASPVAADAAKYEPRPLLIAGSVGPYGAYLANGSEYRGDYSLPDDEMKEFHRPRIAALVEAGVDLLAIETMPSFEEIKVLLALLNEEFDNTPVWVGMTLRDKGHLSDGTDLESVVKVLNGSEQVVALGVNCVPQNMVVDALDVLNKLTSKPLLAYPNSGEKWDAEKKIWTGEQSQGHDIEGIIKEWYQRGARLIGGCCRTGPQDIQKIKQAFI